MRLSQGSASTIQELQKEFTKQEIANLKHKPYDPNVNPPDNEHIVLTILESNNLPPSASPTSTRMPMDEYIVNPTQFNPLNLKSYIKYASYNQNYGSPLL